MNYVENYDDADLDRQMAMVPWPGHGNNNYYYGNNHRQQQQHSDHHRHWGSSHHNDDYYNHHGRLSSSAVAASHPMAIPEGALPGGRYVQRHHLHLTSSGYHSYNYMEYAMPWEEEGWVPLTKSGKQKSPNQIRNQLQRYIDQCRADGTSNQTKIIEKMGVNSNSFRKFMDPSTYRNQWNATSNGTYWAAAKLLEKVAYEKELAKVTKKSGSKRKSTRDNEYDSDSSDDDVVVEVVQATKKYKSNSGTIKKSRLELEVETMRLMNTVHSVTGVQDDGIVYDTCPQLVKKIKDFLEETEGLSKKNFLQYALLGVNSNSLNTFLAGKRQDQAGNITYRRAYVFFEKLRILEGEPKSSARLMNEIEHPYGFPLEKPR